MITLGGLLTFPRLDGVPRPATTVTWVGFACGALLALTVFVWDAAQAVPNGTRTVLHVLPQRFLWTQFLAALGLMAMPLLPLGWPRAFTVRREAVSATEGHRSTQPRDPKEGARDDRPQP